METKTVTENANKDYFLIGNKSEIQGNDKEAINYIERNKRLGRVADINKRRFSGAFDHLNVFPAESLSKDRIMKLNTLKRVVATARAGSRRELNNSESNKWRTQTALAIDSYRNKSINEK